MWEHAGRVEFTEYFPENTQGVLVQPIGEDGLLVCGTDVQRGFGRLDQVCLICIFCHAVLDGSHFVSDTVDMVRGLSPAGMSRFFASAGVDCGNI